MDSDEHPDRTSPRDPSSADAAGAHSGDAPANVLVLVRHGQSEWNAQNRFTGWRDPGLTDRGMAEARRAGTLLRHEGHKFNIAYSSVLQRANHTLDLILETIGQTDIEIVCDKALNERDYGDLSGLNKADAAAKWGDHQIHEWRRSFDIPPPGGESLKDTLERVLPYYKANIWPKVRAGQSVIISAHGNSLRALIMHLDAVSPEEILSHEVDTGAPMVYRLTKSGAVHSRVDLVKSMGGPDQES